MGAAEGLDDAVGPTVEGVVRSWGVDDVHAASVSATQTATTRILINSTLRDRDSYWFLRPFAGIGSSTDHGDLRLRLLLDGVVVESMRTSIRCPSNGTGFLARAGALRCPGAAFARRV